MEVLAKLKREIEVIRKEIQCPVCLEVMVEPHGLPCMHHFCQGCIRRALGIRRECPVCNLPTYPRALGKNRNMVVICEAFERITEILQPYENEGVYNLCLCFCIFFLLLLIERNRTESHFTTKWSHQTKCNNNKYCKFFLFLK
jgi:hypothetical protein